MIKRIMLVVFLIIAYLFVINYLDFSKEDVFVGGSLNIGQEGSLTLHTSDSVGVSVKRPRIYGTIYEAEGISELLLLNFIPIPIKKGISYKYIHLTFLLLIIFILLKGGKNKMKDFDKRRINPKLKTFLNSIWISALYLLISLGNWENTLLLLIGYNYFESVRRN